MLKKYTITGSMRFNYKPTRTVTQVFVFTRKPSSVDEFS